MQRNKWKLAIVIAFTLIGSGAAHAQSAIDELRPLVETSARRLVIAEEVALAKWDSGARVEDAPREAQVIKDAVRDGESRGLDPTSVSDFFNAEIEANKFVQYSLLATWHRAGKAPTHAPIDLVSTIRPELDQVQTELIAELADTAVVRSGTSCPADVAKAVGKYVLTHKRDVRPLQAMALDRALAAACAL